MANASAIYIYKWTEQKRYKQALRIQSINKKSTETIAMIAPGRHHQKTGLILENAKHILYSIIRPLLFRSKKKQQQQQGWFQKQNHSKLSNSNSDFITLTNLNTQTPVTQHWIR